MVLNKTSLAVMIVFIGLFCSIANAGQNNLSSQFLMLPVEGNPDMVLFDKGKILYSQMAYEEAFDTFTKIDKTTIPDISDESSYLSAICLMETGNYNDATSFANAVSDKGLIYPFALYTRAMISLKAGNEKSAAGFLEDIIKYARTAQPSAEIERLSHRSNLTLGFMHLENGAYNESLKYFSAIPRDSQFYSKALFGLGWTYARMERWVRSVVVWEELFSLYPDSPYTIEIVPYIGYAYTKLNAYGKAIEQNGTALRYYKDTYEKITELRNEMQHGDIDKLILAVNSYGDSQMSDNLKLYKGLLQMEEYLGQKIPVLSHEAETLINSSKKMREDILDNVYVKAQVYLEQLQIQLLETSIDTTLVMAQNLRLEGGGQISSDMTFIDHD